MLFTVVVPTHKRKELLSQLLNSLEKQKLDKNNFEVIVVATEKDESLGLDTSQWNFSLKIIAALNDPLKGKSAAAKRNLGVQKATTPWIAFVDDDCVTSPLWLQAAKDEIEKISPHMIEGGVHIPVPEKKTLTYKGIKRLSSPGGYQTCNMFYKKEDFLQVGGFDLNFPFYLEDTDLAWTMLANNKTSSYCPEAQVSHPVPPPEPKRLLSHAQRMDKLIYLYKKHPQRFKSSNMKLLPRAYWILITVDLLTIATLFCCSYWTLPFIAMKLTLTFAYLTRMYKDCHYTTKELLSTYYYILICPIIALTKMLYGIIKHRFLPL